MSTIETTLMSIKEELATADEIMINKSILKEKSEMANKKRCRSSRRILKSCMDQMLLERYYKMQNKMEKESTTLDQKNKKGKKAKDKTFNIFDAKVHRFNDLKCIPSGILTMSNSHPYSNPLVAISRENGYVEIRDPNQKFRLVSDIPGFVCVDGDDDNDSLIDPRQRGTSLGGNNSTKKQVDSLVWLSEAYENARDLREANRMEPLLFSSSSSSKKNDINFADNKHTPYRRLYGACQSTGSLFEIDYHSQSLIKNKIVGSGGGAIFCLSSHPTSFDCAGMGYICAGCEDGSVRIFNQDLELKWTLPTTGAPIISICWQRSTKDTIQTHGNKGYSTEEEEDKVCALAGSIIYAGCADGTIRKYDCFSSSNNLVRWKASYRITLIESGNSEASTKPWSLQVFSKNGVLVSGDSLGQVQFWSPEGGVLQDTFIQNQQLTPVLDVCIEPMHERQVFASGIDSRVICIEQTTDFLHRKNSRSQDRWKLAQNKRPHTHDVRSLIITSRIAPTLTSSQKQAGTPGKRTINGEKKASSSALALSSDSSSSWIRKVFPVLCSGGMDTKLCHFDIINVASAKVRRTYSYFGKICVAQQQHNEQKNSSNKDGKTIIISVQRENKIDFYQINTVKTLSKSAFFSSNTKDDEENPRGDPPLDYDDEEDKHFVGSIEMKTKFNFSCSAISSDGKFFAVSDSTNLYVFHLEYSSDDDDDDEDDDLMGEDMDDNSSGKKLQVRPTLLQHKVKKMKQPCTSLKFVSNFESPSEDKDVRLVCATSAGPINLFKITFDPSSNNNGDEDDYDENRADADVELEYTFNRHLIAQEDGSINDKKKIVLPVQKMEISPNLEYLACQQYNPGRTDSIHVYSLKDSSNYYFKVPRMEVTNALQITSDEGSEQRELYDIPTSATTFQFSKSNVPSLIVACANYAFYIFDLTSKSLVEWSKRVGTPMAHTLPRQLTDRFMEFPSFLAFNKSTVNRFVMVS